MRTGGKRLRRGERNEKMLSGLFLTTVLPKNCILYIEPIGVVRILFQSICITKTCTSGRCAACTTSPDALGVGVTCLRSMRWRDIRASAILSTKRRHRESKGNSASLPLVCLMGSSILGVRDTCLRSMCWGDSHVSAILFGERSYRKGKGNSASLQLSCMICKNALGF